jgi:hypothetical protein
MKHHAALRSALTWTRANGGARRAIAEVQPEDMAAAAVKFITGPCWMCRADSGVGGEGSCGLTRFGMQPWRAMSHPGPFEDHADQARRFHCAASHSRSVWSLIRASCSRANSASVLLRTSV